MLPKEEDTSEEGAEGGRGFAGRTQRKLFYEFYGENKGHTMKYCEIMIQKNELEPKGEQKQHQGDEGPSILPI